MARAMPKVAVAAESLQSRLDAGERFGQSQLLNLLRAVGDALGDAHRDGRFHGTITPADIRFDAAGEVELDGWERDSTPDVTRASRYAAIECYAPVHPQGPWTDVYALGAVLWHAIAGEPPAEVLHRKGDVTLTRLAPPGFDPAFLSHIDAALEIAPQRRPQSVEHWLAMFEPALTKPDEIGVEAAPPVPDPLPAPPGASDRVWRLGWRWPAFAGLFAGLGAVWLTFPPEPPTESVAPDTAPAPAPPPVSVEAAPEAAPPAIPSESPAATVEAQAPPPSAQPTLPPTAAPAPSAVARTAAPPPPSAEPPPVRVAPEPVPEPEPPAEAGEAPRALLVRADKRLRRLFDDYARMRARIERTYDDSDVLYGVKLRAYRESRRIQRELVALRDVRNQIARTGNFRAANRRYDELERSAAELSARMEAVRESL